MKTTELIRAKLKEMGPWENIPKDAVHHIEVEGQITATYCGICRRFVKGSKKHSTAEHKSKPPKASGMMASVAPVPSSEPPAPSPPEAPMSAALRPPASCDLGAMPTVHRASANFASGSTAPADDGSVHSVDDGLLAALNSYPKG